MALTRVTITGADDRVDPAALAALSWDFPFVEWGILFSRSREGSSRYPGQEWRARLFDTWSRPSGWNMKLAAHFCGSIARSFLAGDDAPLDDLSAHYRRLQLNGWGPGARFPDLALRDDREFVLQVRSAEHLQEATNAAAAVTASVSALWDCSGGRGVEPSDWPAAPDGLRIGYAGGIGPDNVTDVLRTLGFERGDYWIDMESGVRTDDRFDLDKVRKVLEAASPFIQGWVR